MSGADSYGGQSDGGQSVSMLRWQSCTEFGISLESTLVVVCTRAQHHKVLVYILDSTTGICIHTSQHHRYLCAYLDSTTGICIHTSQHHR